MGLPFFAICLALGIVIFVCHMGSAVGGALSERFEATSSATTLFAYVFSKTQIPPRGLSGTKRVVFPEDTELLIF